MPVWEAQYIVVVASKTGWTEDFIRWRLPLARGWAYYHTARLLEGERCRWPGKNATLESWFSGLRATLKNIVGGKKHESDRS